MAVVLFKIDGVPVEREESPASPEELSEVLRRAHAASTAVVPLGGGTRLHLGNPPRSAELVVRMERMRGIVEYEPDNMTVSVLAGTPLKQVQDALRRNRQFLPLDPPRPEEATMGGLVACNTSGPIRFHYGTARDLLLGVKTVHADGTRTKAGGKLVKNVTGYDMCKLYTGSLGTLGILCELTFKVLPKPETQATALLSYPSARAALAATQTFLQSDLLPEAVEAWNGAAFESLTRETGQAWVLMLRFGEVAPAVEWQLNRLKEILPGTGGELLRLVSTDDSAALWDAAASARDAFGDGEAVVKCSATYAAAAPTIRRLEEMGKRLGARTSVYCHAASGVVYGRHDWTDGRPPAETLRRELAALQRQCAEDGGHAVVEKVRPEVKAGLDVWGYDAPALKIMRSIKHEFDPKGILNPGRFVGGI